MAWLDDLLANLQGGGGVLPGSGMPPMFAPAPPASPFPPTAEQAAAAEAQAALEAREAAAARMGRANRPRVAPFGVPDMDAAGIQLALGQGPAGTGVPGVTGAGAPDGSPFGAPAPFGLSVPPSLKLAQAATEPPPAAPEAPAGPVPMPRPRPDMAPATDLSSQNRQPPAPAAAAPAAAPMSLAGPPAEPGFMERLQGISPGLIAAGAALQGDNSVAASMLQRQEALKLAKEGQNLTATALLQRGAPAQEVAAAVRNPELMKALVTRYFETGKPMVVGGHVVREKAGGGLEVMGDFSTDKAPKQRELKLPDGSVQQQEYVDGKWQDVGKPAPGERDRRMSVSDITKLSEEGAKADQVRGFAKSFQPEYAGYKVNAVGDLANQAGRNLPESVVGKKVAEGAAWWQDYDRYKNMVRHGLYGASLTANETKAFQAADITPGMDPKQIERNLATQQRLIDNSIRRKGKALIGSTYDRNAIAQAYGVAPDFFDQPMEEPPARSTARPGGAPKPGNYAYRNGALVPE